MAAKQCRLTGTGPQRARAFSRAAIQLVEPDTCGAHATRIGLVANRRPWERRMRQLILIAGLAAFAAVAPAAAQDYPNRAIKFVVPYPPGGSVDPVARILGADIAERLKQPVVIENKAGAA